MPIFNQVKTIESKQIWKSPDGQRVIYEVTLELQGKPMKAKTYSEALTQVGRVSDVETYEKEGRNGVETFVKQAPKDGGAWNAGSTSNGSASASSTSSTTANQPPTRNDTHIKAQWSIGQAVLVQAAYRKDDDGGHPMEFDFEATEHIATQFYHMVDRVKDSEPPRTDAEAGDMQQLDAFMNESETVQLGEDPWRNS